MASLREQDDDDDDELARQAQQGDADAFADIYKRYIAPITRFIAHLVSNSEDAEDLAQETLIKAYRNISQLREGRALQRWLYTIAGNVVYDFRRRRQVSNAPLPDPDNGSEPDIPDPHTRIEELVETWMRLDQTWKDMESRLNPKQRECFILWMQGKEIEEIAAQTGLKVSAIKTYLSEARCTFLEAYRQRRQGEEHDH